MLYAYSFIRGYQSLEIYSVFRFIWNYDKLRCFRNANVSTTWHKYGNKARLSHTPSSFEVPTDSVWAWNKAGEKRQITSFKVPLRDWWLGRCSKKINKKKPLRSYQSFFTATTHSPAQLPSCPRTPLLPVSPTLTSFSLSLSCFSFNHHLLTPTSFALVQAWWANNAHFSRGGGIRHMDSHYRRWRSHRRVWQKTSDTGLSTSIPLPIKPSSVFKPESKWTRTTR